MTMREFDPLDRRSLAVRLSRDRSGSGDRGCERANPSQRENNPFHILLLIVGDWILFFAVRAAIREAT